MPLGLTPLHLVIILVIALIIMGPGKLPEVGSALGKSIREFRTASSDAPDAARVESSEKAPASVPGVAETTEPTGATPAAATAPGHGR
jgi:sec-independent protein translocase protein TatA